MKKTFINLRIAAQRAFVISIFFLLSIRLVSAQQANSRPQPSTPSYDIYMHRHKTCKTVAWVFLSTGVALGVAGYIDAAGSPGFFFSSRFDTGVGMMFIGGLVVIPSLPLFIIARSNKKKAMLQLKTGSIPGPGKFSYAGVSLKINL